MHPLSYAVGYFGCAFISGNTQLCSLHTIFIFHCLHSTQVIVRVGGGSLVVKERSWMVICT